MSVGVYVLYGENREWLVYWCGVAVTMGSPQKNCLSHLSLELGWCEQTCKRYYGVVNSRKRMLLSKPTIDEGFVDNTPSFKW